MNRRVHIPLLCLVGAVFACASCSKNGSGGTAAGAGDGAAEQDGGGAGGNRAGGPRVEKIVKENGLVIEDLKPGDGQLCLSARETVKVHYRGTLEDGTEFDSSYGDKPIEFPLRDLIEGWKQGIPGMKVGGKRRLTVPWQLAYGERAVRGDDGAVLIPARSNLIFEIELLDVKSK